MASEDKKAGIAWAGSLVGCKNPNAPTGYRYTSKRYRVNDDASPNLPSNIQVSFQNRQGTTLAETLDLPINSTIDDLNALVNQLNESADSNVPYSFYASLKETADTPVESDLKSLFTKHDLSTENVLVLTYQPLAIFRVRPVTRCTDTLQGHTDSVLHVSYSASGSWLASGGGDCCVRFWDVHTSTCQFKFSDVHKDHVLCTAWSPDATRFASADKRGNLVIWNMASKPPAPQTISKAHSKHISSIAWEPLHVGTGERLATASKDCSVKIWNARTRKVQFTLSGHTDAVEAIKWGAEFLYSASRDRTIKVWNPERGILVKTLVGHGHRVNTLALNCDSVLRCGPFDYKHTSYPNPESMRKAAKEKFEEFREQHPHDVLVSGSDDFTLFLWHPTLSKHPIKRLTGHQQAVNHISFSPDGRHFASASFDKKIKIWNGVTGDFVQTLTGHVGAVYQVAWSADSRHLVTASKDSTSKLWCIGKSKTAIHTLPGHADEVYALDWSPTSGAVATGSKDRTIKIWKH